MHFFRFRVVNTVLFFVLGVLVGFILKDRSAAPAARAEAERRYQPDYEEPRHGAENLSDETPDIEEAEDEERIRPAGRRPAAPPPAAAEISLESARAASPQPSEAVLVDPKIFFSGPAAYAGRDVELNLQMISAKRAAGGLRLNFSYLDADGRSRYLYAEDAGRLGEKPDLKIGFFYRVRFTCGSGSADGGNIIISVTPTGQKADWATGMSALE